MVQLTEKSVEELRKMASKKKIKGRSKMNKAQLVRALSKKKKMIGGRLNDNEINLLTTRNYTTHPLFIIDITGVPFFNHQHRQNRSMKIIRLNRYIDIHPNNPFRFDNNMLEIEIEPNVNNTAPRTSQIVYKNSELCRLNGDFLEYSIPFNENGHGRFVN